MKKILLTCFLAICLFIPNIVSAQDWVQDQSFNLAIENDSLNLRSLHGVTVDPDDNVWIQQYYADSKLEDGTSVRGIYVYNSDNEQVDFSPITMFEWEDGSRVDTAYNTGLGLSTDYDGNIIVTSYHSIYKLDYKTGKVLAYVDVEDFIDFGETNKSLTKASADAEGNIYIRAVFPGIPLVKYDSDLKNPEVLIEEPANFSRSIQVSADGMTIWQAGYPLKSVQRYTKEDEYSSFGEADTVLVGLAVEAFTIQKSTGLLWVGAGSDNDWPDLEKYNPERFYAFNMDDLGTENEAPVDSLVFNNGTSELYTSCRPRGIDFTDDGNTAYIVMFECPQPTNAVQKFEKAPTVSNENENLALPNDYTLEQNYPNPFNPTTNISFTLKDAGMVSIKVYDMTGREVATIANSRYTAGTHQATFDASNLSSGVYIYSLQANGVRLTNKMTLIK